MESIGEKIRRIRKSKGISQTAVSDTCGIKQSSYANIESGKTQNITIEIGKGIAKALEISFNELFDIDQIIEDDIIKELKNKKEWLIKENERKQKEIDNYQTLISLLKEKNMITSPREVIIGENEFKPAGDEYLKEAILTMDEDERKVILEIQNDPNIRGLLESGSLKEGSYYEVWVKHFKKQ